MAVGLSQTLSDLDQNRVDLSEWPKVSGTAVEREGEEIERERETRRWREEETVMERRVNDG